MSAKILTTVMVVLAAAAVAGCGHDPLHRRSGETDLQYQERVQKQQRAEQEAQQQRQRAEQTSDSATRADAQREQREGILLSRLPTGSYPKAQAQPCRDGFKTHRETIGQQVAEQGSGETFYFCVPES